MIGLQIAKVEMREDFERPEYETLRQELFKFLAGAGAAMSASARARIWEITDVLAKVDPYMEFFDTFGESVTVTSAGYTITVNLIDL